jgi:hypothetical protein
MRIGRIGVIFLTLDLCGAIRVLSDLPLNAVVRIPYKLGHI